MRLARVNTILVVLIVAVNLYIIAMPFAPQLMFWWQNRGTHGLSDQLQQEINPSNTSFDMPDDNRLVVPSMGLNQPIIEGKTEHSLMKGPWRLPKSSSPGEGGNTVIAGHRFTYTNPRGSFYFLDKVKVGDRFAVFWDHKAYLYKVVTTQVVPPTQVSIEDQTNTAQVTLFTCTPLWWPKDRLVVVGTLEQIYE